MRLSFSAFTLNKTAPLPNSHLQFGHQWAGDDNGNADVFAYALKKEAEAQVEKQLVEPIPHFDYVRYRLTEAGALEFSESKFPLGEQNISGQKIVKKLLSPLAIDPQNIPRAELMTASDYPQCGVSEKDLRDWLKDDAIKGEMHQLMDILNTARHSGIIYKLMEAPVNNKGGMTYYGVPLEVRDMLNLNTKQVEKTESIQSEEPQALHDFKTGLISLLKKTENLNESKPFSEQAEFFEYLGQMANAVIQKNLLTSKALPTAYLTYQQKESSPEPLADTLLTLYEFSLDLKEHEQAIAELCHYAIELGLLDASAFNEIQLN